MIIDLMSTKMFEPKSLKNLNFSGFYLLVQIEVNKIISRMESPEN